MYTSTPRTIGGGKILVEVEDFNFFQLNKINLLKFFF
jgi:hypothetical protein